MWRPSIVERQLGVRRRRRRGRGEQKSSRCSVLEITPGSPGRPQVALQPLGQPGAARPDADQPPSGLQQAAHAGAAGRRRALRRRARCGSCGRLARNCSRISAAAAASRSRGAARRAPRSVRVALVDLVHRQAEAACKLAAEAARALGVVVRRRRRDGRARRRPAPPGCHSAISRAMAAKRASPCGGDGAERRRAARSANCRWRRRPAAVPKSKARKDVDGGSGGGRRSAHACPASELSMPASMPSSDSALS